MGHATFTYEYYLNEGTKKGLSNAANVVHSFDAYVLRSMHRRCNYDPVITNQAATAIAGELYHRSQGWEDDWVTGDEETISKVYYYMEQYKRSTIADVVILPYLNNFTVKLLDTKHLEKLGSIIAGMLQYKPFPIVTVHDAFASHPNNVNWVRWRYKEILADIAESDVLTGVMNEIHGVTDGAYQKVSDGKELAQKIRNGSYGLC